MATEDSDVKENIEETVTDNKSLEVKTEYTLMQGSTDVKHIILKTIGNVICSIIVILALAFTIFSILNVDNSSVANGISVLGVDISGLDKETAITKINQEFSKKLSNNITLKHDDFEASLSPDQLEVSLDVEGAVTAAFELGSGSNIFSNGIKKLSLLINNNDIIPDLTINESNLINALDGISKDLPDAVKESSYYIEDNNLIITPGKAGVVVDTETMTQTIKNSINNLSYVNEPIEIVTIAQEPEEINIENIYNEIKKDPVDASYVAETHVVYPEEDGLDFAISLDEAKELLASGTAEEYTIPLSVLKPSVTTDMIGMEAFPDLLASFSTKYATSNKDRTTNLILASNKVNGTVLLPGETFSYNTTVGERTIAAGYKEAAIYQDGEVVSGLGGGICQISSTLYNAVLYANLEVVERRNHQFVPSYVSAGRDATVVYGSQDFKFKNNRNYAIKIVSSVGGGVAKFEIYGLREENDYEVVISSSVTSRTSSSLTSATYKTLKQNGATVSSEVVSRDTYKVH